MNCKHKWRARGKSYLPLPDVINDVLLEVTISYHYQLRQRCNSERNQNLSLSTLKKADDGYIQLPAENIDGKLELTVTNHHLL